jgi:hypothetical protein
MIALNTLEVLALGWVPRYQQVAPPTEVLLTMPWIDDGVPVRLVYLPSVLSAAFRSADTSFFAIRPYGASWKRQNDEYSRLRGRWRIDAIGLEQYGRSGHRLRAYAIPNDVESLKADDRGYLLLGSRSGMTSIVTEGYVADPCAFPTAIQIALGDFKPKAVEIK